VKETFKRLHWHLREEIFNTESLYKYVENFAINNNFKESIVALPFMKEKHQGQYRNKTWFARENNVEYINHPLSMAKHSIALGIYDDNILASILLHDVCEDCDVHCSDLPCNDIVKEVVKLLSYNKDSKLDKETLKEIYYTEISKNPIATIVKILDRCNNISNMAASFHDTRLINYINDTQMYVFPLLEHIYSGHMLSESQIFLLQYQMFSIIESIKNMILR
jgi:hypothetical protein